MGRAKVNKKEGEVVSLDLNNRLVKFQSDAIDYSIGDNVMEKYDFATYAIEPGTQIEISYNDEHVISFIKKLRNVQKNPPNNESTTETANVTGAAHPIQEAVNGIFTIFGITPKKEVIKFDELRHTNKWYKLTEELQKQDLKALGIVARARVNVKFDGDDVVALEAIGSKEVPEKEQEVKHDSLHPTEDTNYGNSNVKSGNTWAEKNEIDRQRVDLERSKQSYINRQSAVKSAVEFVNNQPPINEGDIADKVVEIAKQFADFIEGK